jgi:hypothetical protein
MVEKSIEICRKLGKSATYQLATFWCADGVYNSLGVAYFNNFYNLSFKDKDPLWICDKQPEEFRKNCYYSPGTLWITKELGTNFELKNAITLSKEIKHEAGRKSVFVRLVQDYYKANINTKQPMDVLRECYTLIPQSFNSCVNGLFEGMIATNPERTSEEIIEFVCKISSNINSKLKSQCYIALSQ